MNEMIKDEEVNTLTKEELLNNALNEAKNKELTERAKLLYKLGLYEKNRDDKFNGEDYEDHTYRDGFKGYSLALKDGILYLVKPLDEEECHSYEVLTLANPSAQEFEILKNSVKKNNVLYYVVLGFFLFYIVVSLVASIGLFLNTVSTDFITALGNSFLCGGTGVVVALGLLVLIIRKGPKGNK